MSTMTTAHGPGQVENLQGAGHRQDHAGADAVAQKRQGDEAHLLPFAPSVYGRRFIQLRRDSGQAGQQDYKIEAHILPYDRHQHGEHRVLRFPVDQLVALSVQIAGELQELVDHALVIQKHQVEQKAERGCRNDNREKVHGPEETGTRLNIAHQQGQKQGDAHLAENGRRDRDARILQGNPHFRVRPQFRVIDIPGRIPVSPGCSHIFDMPEAVQYILDKRVIKVYQHKQKSGKQEHPDQLFVFVDICTHPYSPSLFSAFESPRPPLQGLKRDGPLCQVL